MTKRRKDVVKRNYQLKKNRLQLKGHWIRGWQINPTSEINFIKCYCACAKSMLFSWGVRGRGEVFIIYCAMTLVELQIFKGHYRNVYSLNSLGQCYENKLVQRLNDYSNFTKNKDSYPGRDFFRNTMFFFWTLQIFLNFLKFV